MNDTLTRDAKRCFRATLVSVCLVASLASTSTPAARSSSGIEVVARRLSDPIGVAVDRDGSVVIVERKAGTISRMAPNDRRTVLVRGLEGPAGVAFDAAGRLLIVEERGQRVLRRNLSGSLEVLATGIVGPRWITTAPDGTIYLSATRLVGSRKRSAKSHGRGHPMQILQLFPSGELLSIAGGFHRLEGLTWADGGLYAAVEKTSTDRGKNRTWLVRVPIGAGGVAGTAESALTGRGYDPTGVTTDRLGALFVSADLRGGGNSRKRGGSRKRHGSRKHDGVILKPFAAVSPAEILSGLRDVQGLAFGPTGDLLIVEGGKSGRLLRVRAPDPPSINAAVFTNQSPVALNGQTRPGQLVHAFRADDFTTPLSVAVGDGTTGAFTLSVPIAFNTDTHLSFVATAEGGLGLSSAPAAHTIAHDDRLPRVTILDPIPGTHVRDVATFRARGEDDDSGVVALAFMLEDTVVATVDNPAPPQPLVGTATLDTRSVAEGPRTVTVVATDRAGNVSADARLLVVDRTSPEVRIVSGPSGETAETTATFVVAGIDLYSPTLDFTWRLDQGAWSPFRPATTIVVNALTPGAHTFEVKARDLAGNESVNRAVQTFTVTTLQIRIIEPAAGAVVTTETVWLRGIVDGGSDVTVTMPLPPGMAIPSLAASTKAGTFAVEVPVDATTTTLTVNAIDLATGATVVGSVDIVVQLQPTMSLPRLTALPAGGLAPHVVTFSVNLAESTRVELDIDSDGTVDFAGATLDGLPFLYERAGIYVPTLRTTTSGGQVHTYRTVVDVYDREALDARLQAVWNGFKDALQGGNVAEAVTFIHRDRRDRWQEDLSQVSPDVLAAIDTIFATIELAGVGAGGAEYELVRVEDGQAFSYPVVFVADADGQWRLWQF